MKKVVLLALVAASMVFSGAFAAQCEGRTQKGERCKREADAGSKFCIGHKDQAKPATAQKKEKDQAKPAAAQKKEKDDGQCWAVTLKGERCKHKKDGESDYCKQHAAGKKVKETPKQCRAMTWDGKRCVRAPDEGYLYCKQHRK